jgi:Fe-S cluster biosynthesis and repair protein YggX
MLVVIRNQYYGIVNYIYIKINLSIELYMKKSGEKIYKEVSYFSWAESAKTILKLREEMINESIQNVIKSQNQNEKAIKV